MATSAALKTGYWRRELFPIVKALIAAAYDFFEYYNRCPWWVL